MSRRSVYGLQGHAEDPLQNVAAKMSDDFVDFSHGAENSRSELPVEFSWSGGSQRAQESWNIMDTGLSVN